MGVTGFALVGRGRVRFAKFLFRVVCGGRGGLRRGIVRRCDSEEGVFGRGVRRVRFAKHIFFGPGGADEILHRKSEATGGGGLETPESFDHIIGSRRSFRWRTAV
jgi:hypothetical protein